VWGRQRVDLLVSQARLEGVGEVWDELAQHVGEFTRGRFKLENGVVHAETLRGLPPRGSTDRIGNGRMQHAEVPIGAIEAQVRYRTYRLFCARWNGQPQVGIGRAHSSDG
jgi:hypothetical protein